MTNYFGLLDSALILKILPFPKMRLNQKTKQKKTVWKEDSDLLHSTELIPQIHDCVQYFVSTKKDTFSPILF